MNSESLTTQDLALLMDHQAKTRDPVAVSLTKILKNSDQMAEGFPLQAHHYDDFHTQGQDPAREIELKIAALERESSVLRLTLANQRRVSEASSAAARAAGLAEGRTQGETAGHARASAEHQVRLTELQGRFSALLAECGRVQREMIAGSEHIVARLSLEIARKIINTELKLQPDLVLHNVKRALSYIADREKIIVRVSPGDVETVSANPDFWKPVSERLDQVSIVPDEAVDKGGCIIESNSGVADARLGVQLSELGELVERTWESLQAQQTASPDIPVSQPPSSR